MMNDDENDNPQHNYGKSALRDFLENLNNGDLPKGWRESPLGKRAWEIGHQAGFEEGYDAAAEQYEKTLSALRHILDLEDQRSCCE